MAQTAGTSFTVNISNSSSMQCPEGQDIVIAVPANGYAEVDFMNVDNILLVRGI